VSEGVLDNSIRVLPVAEKWVAEAAA